MLRLFQVGACDHEFLTAGVLGSLDHVGEVVFMGALAVVYAPEDRVAEVYANL